MNKALILQACKDVLLQKKAVITSAIKEIQESMLNETKSALGDKHETARAKMQSEQEKLEKQLLELHKQWQVLDKININQTSQIISLGTLIQTHDTYFFIAIGLGKIVIESKPIYVISPYSPIGQLFHGLNQGAHFEFNNIRYTVISIE